MECKKCKIQDKCPCKTCEKSCNLKYFRGGKECYDVCYDKVKMKLKPRAEIITSNNNMRFEPIYKCYCPKCGQPLKRENNLCKCGQEIDWSEWK